MTEHCNVFAARAVSLFNPPFGLPNIGGPMPPYGDLSDPRMAALIRERALLFGGMAGGPMLMPGASTLPPYPTGDAARHPNLNSFGMPPSSHPMFWSTGKPGTAPGSNPPTHPSNGQNMDTFNDLYNLPQCGAWYSALVAANNGRIPSMPSQNPTIPTSGPTLQFAAQLAASNPIWAAAAAAAAAAYGGNTGPNMMTPASTLSGPSAKSLLNSPTFLKSFSEDSKLGLMDVPAMNNSGVGNNSVTNTTTNTTNSSQANQIVVSESSA